MTFSLPTQTLNKTSSSPLLTTSLIPTNIKPISSTFLQLSPFLPSFIFSTHFKSFHIISFPFDLLLSTLPIYSFRFFYVSLVYFMYGKDPHCLPLLYHPIPILSRYDSYQLSTYCVPLKSIFTLVFIGFSSLLSLFFFSTTSIFLSIILFTFIETFFHLLKTLSSMNNSIAHLVNAGCSSPNNALRIIIVPTNQLLALSNLTDFRILDLMTISDSLAAITISDRSFAVYQSLVDKHSAKFSLDDADSSLS